MALQTFMKDFDLNIDNDAIQQFMKVLAKRSLGYIDSVLAPVSFQPKLKSYSMINHQKAVIMDVYGSKRVLSNFPCMLLKCCQVWTTQNNMCEHACQRTRSLVEIRCT